MSENPPSSSPGQPDDTTGTPPPPPPAGAPGAMGGPTGSEGGWSASGNVPGGMTGAERYGGLGKRFGARIIDALIVGIPVGILLVPLGGMDVGGIGYTLVTSLINLAYFMFLESSQGGTLGKRMLGMSVTSEGGGAISMEQSFKRNWWLLLSLIPVIGGLAGLGVAIYIAVTISSDARNRGFHDKLADAVVLDR